jgi:hypothetical protein
MNLIEQYLVENVPIKLWRRACRASPAANDLCGLILVATGLVDKLDSEIYDMTSDDNEYVKAYFQLQSVFSCPS